MTQEPLHRAVLHAIQVEWVSARDNQAQRYRRIRHLQLCSTLCWHRRPSNTVISHLTSKPPWALGPQLAAGQLKVGL